MKKKILVSGGSGRFGTVLKKNKNNYSIFYPTKKELDILNYKKIQKYLKKKKPDIFIHLAGLSRPMKIHDTNIKRSIDLNIIGTANVTKACESQNIKLIYFSTNYVYPGTKGNYKETDPIFPTNNYAWSKLGGETSVRLYKNSLILRVCMTEKPFVHKKAFANVETNFIYHEDVVPILFRVLNKKGVLNIGGKKQTIFNFAKKENNKVKKIYLRSNKLGMPRNASMNLYKLNSLIK
tara:strand:+ start:93 stop:800 length:708 start_codon:yes stop_codon:yes gene_type:complete